MSDVFVDDDDSAVATLLERVIRNGKRKRMRRMFLHELFDSEELAEIDGRGKFSAARPGGGNGASGRPDYWDSCWGRLLKEKNEQLEDLDSSESAVFRRRFRVPYPIFLKIVDAAKARFPEKQDAAKRPVVPLKLKVLGVLRVLGRATEFDGITELSGISEETMRAFFHSFCKWFRDEIYPKFVHMPSTPDEAAEILAAYARVGLPGAIGSMDVVHLAWCMCPAALGNLATGKEGYPSVAYNVMCDHSGRVLCVLPGAYGATNDKTIVQFDNFVDDVRTGPFFTGFGFEVRNGPDDGDREMVHGLWIIVDGGYHKWRALQAASQVDNHPSYVAFRKTMESVRKDIEDVFGRLKNRFRVLKTPMTFHSKEKIDNVMFTCVALHNMLLEWDCAFGKLMSWEVEAGWGNFTDEDGADEGDARLWCRPKLVRQKRGYFIPDPEDDFSSCGSLSIPIGAGVALGANTPPAPDEESAYYELHAKLVAHHAHSRAAHAVGWLRS